MSPYVVCLLKLLSMNKTISKWTNESAYFPKAHTARIICSYNCVQALFTKQTAQAV